MIQILSHNWFICLLTFCIAFLQFMCVRDMINLAGVPVQTAILIALIFGMFTGYFFAMYAKQVRPAAKFTVDLEALLSLLQQHDDGKAIDRDELIETLEEFFNILLALAKNPKERVLVFMEGGHGNLTGYDMIMIITSNDNEALKHMSGTFIALLTEKNASDAELEEGEKMLAQLEEALSKYR